MSPEDLEWKRQRDAAKAKQLALRSGAQMTEKEYDEVRRSAQAQQAMMAAAGDVRPADLFSEGQSHEIPVPQTTPGSSPTTPGELSFWIVTKQAGGVFLCAASWKDLKKKLKNFDGTVSIQNRVFAATEENTILFFIEGKDVGVVREEFSALVKDGIVFRSDPD